MRRRPFPTHGITAALLAAVLLLPVVALVLWSFAGRWPVTEALPTQWSSRGFEEAFDGAAVDALVLSTGVAVAAMALALLVGVPAGFGFARLSGARAAAARLLVLLPIILPLLAYVLGLQVLLVRLGWIESVPGLVAVHALLAVPYVVLAVETQARQLDPGLEDAARNLGARRLQVLYGVVLPQLRASIVFGAVLAFLVSWSDYLAALTIGTGTASTLPVTLSSLVVADDRAVSGAVAVMILVPVAVAVVVLRKSASFAGGLR